VGLGSHYQGEVAVVDDTTLALWENLSGGVIDPEHYTALRNVRTEIQLDIVNVTGDGSLFVNGGSLTFQIDDKATGDHLVYEASRAEGMIAPVADGYDGFVEFTGTLTINRSDLPPQVTSDWKESFELAIDAAGQPVLCQTLPLPTLDGVRQYQDCLARAVVRLQPVQPLA
jgi:hypothetical protein